MLETITVGNANDKIYNAKSIMLPNAMQVVVVENHRTPAVTHMVWYRIGGGDEVSGKSGLAHYLEHLMFKGTDLVSSGGFSKKVKSWGGNDNAFTSWDFTAYYQNIPKDKLNAVMIMESDRMRNLNFDDQDALTERDVVIQERKQRTDSNPAAQLDEAMRASLFVNHPYGRPIIGWDHEIQKLSPEAAREFYKTYYAPRNAILVVSGDVDTKQVFEQAALTYGELDNKGSSKRPTWPVIPNMYGETTIEHNHTSIRQSVWRKMFLVPSVGVDYKESLAMSLADNIIGGNTGKLYQSLVTTQKIASAASFRYGGINIANGVASVGVTPMDGVDMDQIKNAVSDLLNDIATNGVSDEDVQKSILQIQDESVYERDSLTGPAMMIGYQLASGLTLDQVETWTKDLENITASDVQQVIQKYLIITSDNYHAVIGQLLPSGK